MSIWIDCRNRLFSAYGNLRVGGIFDSYILVKLAYERINRSVKSAQTNPGQI